MSWDGTLSTAVVGALMQRAKMMPAIAKFILNTNNLCGHIDALCEDDACCREFITLRQLLREGSVSSDGLRQGSFHSSCGHVEALCDS